MLLPLWEPRLVQHDELLGIADRQLPQHELIHEGEDGGIGADAQGERKDRHGSKQRTSADRPEGIPHLARQDGHRCLYCGSACCGYAKSAAGRGEA